MADDGDFFSKLSGFLSSPSGPPPANPQADNAQYAGSTDGAVYNARRQALGNVGALLLSSAQRQSPDQRAATLAQIGTASDPQASLSAQQQTLLKGTQVKQMQLQLQAAKALQEYAKDPRIQTVLADLPPAQQFAAKAAIMAGDVKQLATIIDSNRTTTAQVGLIGAQTQEAQAKAEAARLSNGIMRGLTPGAAAPKGGLPEGKIIRQGNSQYIVRSGQVVPFGGQ